MTQRLSSPEPRSGLDLVEEAVHLLRQTPQALAPHLIGTAPFAVGLLYFWADMSRGAFADRRCASEALLLALLYLWMKTWHCIFARRLYAELAGEPPARWTWRRLARVALVQAAFQPTSFVLLPVAALLTVPFAWMCAFYQNLAVVADDETGSLVASARKAWRLARLWPGQNHSALAATWFFGLFVFLNVLIALWLAPYLVKMFSGIETWFTIAGSWMFSSTTFAAAAVVSWVLVSALTRTIYIVRCFQGESVRTGQDLLVELRSLSVAFVLGILLLGVPTVSAQNAPVPAPISATELDRQIEQTLQQTRYRWRFPRAYSPKDEQRNWWTQLAHDLTQTVKEGIRSLLRAWRKFNRWLRERFGWQPREKERDSFDLDWPQSVRALLFVLTAFVASLLAVLGWRYLRRRQRRTEAELVPDRQPVALDVADENTTAEQLPEDDWLARARELCEVGEWRLALRALYLAMLAHLGRRELITLARHKSNLEYERELARRAREQPELLAAFRVNRTLFEASWYGERPVDDEVLSAFQTRLERIRPDVSR